MSDPLRFGVIGAGAIAINAALEHLSKEDVRDKAIITAICDPVPGRAKILAEKYKVPAAYLTVEELLADPNVDAVTICSPIGLHYQHGMAAIAAGKHVHFNKTMATTLAECNDLIEAAKKKNVKIVASPGQMLRPFHRRQRRLVASGALGIPIWASVGCAMSHYHTAEKVRSSQGPAGAINPEWYYKKPGGGPLYDGAVYGLHSLTGLMGPVKRVVAMSGLVIKEREFEGKRIKCEMDDNTFAILDFGNSFFACLTAAVLGNFNEGYLPTIFGTKGTIRGTTFIPRLEGKGNAMFGDNGEPQNLALEGDHLPHVSGVHLTMKEQHVFEDMMQLVDWVKKGIPSIVTAEHARHVIEIIEAIYKSAETGTVQTITTTYTPLPPEACME
jgi:predicted dehydrogenase